MANGIKQIGHERKTAFTLSLAALGVVFGDIGTSPLYAVRECFSGTHGVSVTPDHVLGVLSMIIWSLILVVSLKYLLFVMRADNRGEGGVLALTALILPRRVIKDDDTRKVLISFGLIGAALLYGDGAITPAISVLSAVEGLRIATTFFEPYIIPITVLILTALFCAQSRGTGSIGKVFGPIICLWFVTLALLGFLGISKAPEVFYALNPIYGINFIMEKGLDSLFTIGSVFLVVTGAEALYADMGHFGVRPIRLGWFVLVFWGLFFNYLGQGALLLTDPSAVTNPFYLLAPSWLLIPLVILSTLATVIASQALISGAFSLTRQAIQLGYLPRLNVNHTSSDQIGQIYVPQINFILWIITIFLVLSFGSSSNLAAAYGVAVSTTMVITVILTFAVLRYRWQWNTWVAVSVSGVFLIIDLAFFTANFIKIGHGGWVPILLAAVIYMLMTTWNRGRELLGQRLREQMVPLQQFLNDIRTDSTIRVPGTAIFMNRNIDKTPPALVHNVKHNLVIHKTVVFLNVRTEEEPYVGEDKRIELENLNDGFYRLTLRYGFMESPDIPDAISRAHGIEMKKVTFFLGRETLIPTDRPGMAQWREHLFAFMSSNAQRANVFYNLPAEQVIEIGFQVEL